MNLKDFPSRVLNEHGIQAVHPDAFLLGLYNATPAQMVNLVENVCAQVELLSDENWPVRKLMKKARLPRLGKALERAN